MSMDKLALFWTVIVIAVSLLYIARNEYNFLSNKKYNPMAGMMSLICIFLLLFVLNVNVLTVAGWISQRLPVSHLNMPTSFAIVICAFALLSMGHMWLGNSLGRQLHKKINGEKT
jgi:hypothetical protein